MVGRGSWSLTAALSLLRLPTIHAIDSAAILAEIDGHDVGEATCAACLAVAREMSLRIHSEATQANFSQGGSAYDWALVGVLEGTCPAVKLYRRKVGHSRLHFSPCADVAATADNDEEAEDDGETLAGYCDALVETHVNDIAGMISQGTSHLVIDLCVALSGACTRTELARMPAESMPAMQGVRAQGSLDGGVKGLPVPTVSARRRSAGKKKGTQKKRKTGKRRKLQPMAEYDEL